MDVLVAGGTGFIGTELCTELADRGHAVTALSRNPADATLPAGVDAVAGDVADPDSIDDAVAGHDAVVNLVALSPLFQPPKGLTQASVHLGGTETLVEAAESASVRRFLQVSGLGADPDAPTAHLRAKGRAEGVVRAADLDTVIVRPSVVFGAGSEFLEFVRLTTVPYLTPLPAGGRMQFQPIWIGDLAPILADCVLEDRTDETYEFGGPERLSLADVTRQYYAARGESVRIIPVPMALSRLGLTLAGPIPVVPFGRDQARALSIDNVVSDNDVTAFGVDPGELRTLGDYLEQRAPTNGSNPRE